MKIGDNVLIRDDDGNFTARGVLIGKRRGVREVRFNYFEAGREREGFGTFNADDIKPIARVSPLTSSAPNAHSAAPADKARS